MVGEPVASATGENAAEFRIQKGRRYFARYRISVNNSGENKSTDIFKNE